MLIATPIQFDGFVGRTPTRKIFLTTQMSGEGTYFALLQPIPLKGYLVVKAIKVEDQGQFFPVEGS